MLKSEIHFGITLSCRISDNGRKYGEIVYDGKFQEEVDAIELSRRQELYYKEGNNDIVGQKKQKARATLDNDDDVENRKIYVGTWVEFMNYSVAFYGTVKCCFVGK